MAIDRLLRATLVILLTCTASAAFSENPYTTEETLAIERACINLGRQYARLVDRGGAAKEISELFDEHGTYEGISAKYVGRENIFIAFYARPPDRHSFHLVSNEIAEVQNRNLTLVESYYVYYRHEGKLAGEFAPIREPYSMGSYHDECVRTDDNSWRWQLRQTKRRFARE